jgi:class 3 adenylate cyclase
VQICPTCGEELPDRFRLCGFCAATLAPPAADAGVRARPRLRPATDEADRVNTGEVIAGDATGNQRLVTGDAVNVAARRARAVAPSHPPG